MFGTDERDPTVDSPEAPFAELVDGVPFGVVTIDGENTIRYANAAVGELLGYDSDDLVGRSLDRIVPDRLRDAHSEGFQRYLETGERRLDWERIEFQARHRAGHEVPITVTLQETSTDGETFYTGVVTDNARSKRLRERLETSIDALHELYVVASNATLSFEARRERVIELGCEYLDLPYGFVTEINPTRQRILASVGDHELLQPGAECPIEESYCRRTVEEDGFLAVANAVEEGWDADFAYKRFDLGSYIGGKLVVDGELFGTLCFASTDPRGREFTETERTFVEMASRWLGYEFQQRRQTRRLERQNERLDRFASQVSHDLRNPLSAAIGRLELAIEEHGDDENLLAVRTALGDADARIDEMLEFARLGTVVTEPESVSLSGTAAEAWSVVDAHGATLDIPDDAELRGDRERLKRLLENLFRNSVEHGGDGVAIRCGALPNDVGFFVEDDGPGIPEDDREKVFEPGYTTSESGTGFGLAIVEEIAAAHGWTVRGVDAAAGGARFEFDGSEPA